MKQKLLFVLLFVVMVLCSQNLWAEDVNKTQREALEELVSSAKEEGYPIFAYDGILEKETVSDEELENAYTELKTAIELTKKGTGAFNGEYKVLFVGNNGHFIDFTDSYWGNCPSIGSNTTLTCYVEVDKFCNFYYTPGCSWGDAAVVDTYVNGKHYANTTRSGVRTKHFRRYIDLQPGKYKIEWVIEGNTDVYVGMMGLYSLPQITVNLLEPGSLGTEILYNVDNVRDVRNLKVYGTLNSSDISTIRMMTGLYILDLSDATYNGSLPKQWWQGNYQGYSNNIHRVHLPQGLTSIGEQCFIYSYLDSITFPASLKTIGSQAFYDTQLENVTLSDNITSMYSSFMNCYNLRSVCNWPKTISEVPTGNFMSCENLKTIELSDGITTIADNAFSGCKILNVTMPKSLRNLGSGAFRSCMSLESIVFYDNNIKIGGGAFEDCRGLDYVELPMVTNDVFNSNGRQFKNCTALKDIVVKSGSVLKEAGELFSGINMGQITVHVPMFLVNYYKLNNFWYNCKIEGFSTEGIFNWDIYDNLTMNANERFEETVSLTIHEGVTFKVNGDASMSIEDLCIYTNPTENKFSQTLNKCENIAINGKNELKYYARGLKWHFVTLPFDIVISDLHLDNDAQYAISYYDGTTRSQSGPNGSWKRYNVENDVISAGTGFIIQTNKDTWISFYSMDNESKQNTVSNNEFVKTLEVNASDVAANRGWNLIGNPYQTYYNNHTLNFTGPITVWNGSGYAAYSLTDDDYAIRPNEAFFVQCPSAEYNTIGFPTQGRQLTNVIESQNAARQMAGSYTRRAIVNVKLSNGESEDQTRVVLNETASMDYELHCDASKMMSMDVTVPQIYTLGEDDVQYAINERPVGTGVVALGFYVAADGDYTLSLGRCDAENVTLIDYEAGTEQPLLGDYTFTAKAGYDNGRFALRFNTGTVTGIETVNNDSINDLPCYNVSGQRVARGAKGIVIVGGRKIVNK